MSKPRSRSDAAARPRRRSPNAGRIRPTIEALEARALLATILVNTAGDGNDPTAATISLREAIEISNGTLAVSSLSASARALVTGAVTAGVPNTIDFGLASGALTISVTSPLPAVTAPVTIDGYSQPGSTVSAPDKTEAVVNNALVRVDGSGLPAPPPGTGYDGLAVATSNCVIDGLIVTGFSGAGVSISGAGSQGNWLWGNFLGALPDPVAGRNFADDPAGLAAASRPQLGNLGAGVRITSSNNRVGGNTPGLPNVIANNGYDAAGKAAGGVGVLIDTAGGTGNLIQGNAVVSNAAQGVLVRSSNNTIGEALGGGGNVIGGNGAQGVEVTGGSNVQGNQLLGNFIGTNLGTPDGKVVKGTAAYSNGAEGVLIEGSPKNTVGGVTTAARNVIGPSALDGVAVDGAASTGNRLLNNYVGFNVVNGLIVFLPNRNGVLVTSSGNLVGDPAAGGSGNTISANRNHGVLLTGAGASGNVVAGNVIGLNPDGGSAFPNAFDGVHLDNAPNNVIGGATPAARNTISANNNGVYVFGAGSTGDVVAGNFIGTGTDGLTDLGNAVNGVVIDSAPGVTVGGTAAGAGNVISGNNRGVVITGAGSRGDLVQGNVIGTDLSGRVNVHNEIDGVLITARASGATVGGLAPGAGNTIVNNVGAGVYVDGGTANSVLSNGIDANTAGGIVLNRGAGANNLQAPPVLSAATPNNVSTFIEGTFAGLPNTSYTLQFFSGPSKPAAGFEQGAALLGTAVVTTDASGSAPVATVVPQAVAAGQWVTATATDPQGDTSPFSAAVQAVPVAVQFSAAGYTVNEAAGQATITVTRTGGFNGVDSVDWSVGGGSAVAGTDYSAVSGTLVFNPGVASQTFTVPVLDPKKVGGSVTVNLTLSNPTNNGVLGANATAVLTVLDNDPANVHLATAQVAVNESAGGYQFTVTRNSPVGTATVDYATADGSARAGVNYNGKSGTLTFGPGVTTQTLTVPILDDGVIAGPLTFSLALSNPVGVTLGSPSSTTVAVLNTDTPGGSPSPVSYTIVVNTTADTVDPTGNTISLREAIELSNGQLPLSALSFAERALVTVSPSPAPTGSAPKVPNTIVFNIPGSGTRTIQVVSQPLPAVTAPVTIDGYSQPGSAVSAADKTEVVANLAAVQIDGSALGPAAPGRPNDGLAVATSNCVIDGLIVTGFSGAGVSISGAGSQGNWLWGNFLGALPDPVAGRNFEVNPRSLAFASLPQIGNLGAGVRITSSNNRVGGNTPGLPNVIANNGYDGTGSAAGGVGVLIDTPGGTGNLVQGNAVFNNAAQGVLVMSSNNTIGEALGGGGNVIGGNGAQGVEVTGGPNVQGNQLLGNLIGTDLGTDDGKVKKGTIAFPNKAQGVLIENSPKNTVGGYSGGARNVIGASLLDGVAVDGAASTGNRLLNNYVGFNVVGGALALLPNQNGVLVTSAGNFIGDAGNAGGGNTISNNRNHGVLLSGAGASGNVVAGNVIGLNPGGGSAFPNAFDGVHLDNAPNNVIGGATPAARNTISANNNGVYVFGAGATGNLIEGDFIGTATDGLTPLGNAVDGVVLDNAPRNTVGGTAAGAGDVISGNNRGVRITGAGAMNNLVQGNFIGTDLTAKFVINNQIDGVLVTAGASNNTIGGLAPGAGNTIAYNAGEGVNLDDGTGNAVLSDGLFANTAPNSISLNPANNANRLQPAPVLTTVIPAGAATTAQGVLTAASDTLYTVQFFASDARDPSGSGQGQALLTTATVQTDAAGRAAFNLNLPSGVTSGQWVTATATDPNGNTSAFSNAVLGVPVSLRLGAASYTVSESAGVAAITVTRSGGMGGQVAVNFTVSGGTAVAGVDYTPVSGTLVFNPGDPATKTFTVPIPDAMKVGGSVSVNVALSSPAGGATLASPSAAVLTVQDDDRAAVGFPAAAVGTSPYTFYGPGVAWFTVTRNTGAGTTSVDYATSDGSAVAGVNYAAASGTLTFAPGQTSLAVPVTVLDDNLFHAAPLTFGLTLSRPTGGAALGPVSTVVASDVTPNAPGAFQLQAPSVFVGAGTTVVPVVVLRTGGKTGAVNVNYATGGGTARAGADYTPVAGTLTFGPGETSKVINVPVVTTGAGGTASFVFGLGRPTGGSTLGAPMNESISIVRGASPTGSTTPGPAGPPVVSDVLPVGGASGYNLVVITYNKPMDAAGASNPRNFTLTFGGRPVPVSRVAYDPVALHTILFLALNVPAGVWTQVGVQGITDTAGTPLDGTGSGRSAGSPYAALITEGASLAYTDRSGDAVKLALGGGGVIAVRRGLDGEAQALRFLGTTPNLSTLTGSVVARSKGQGTTSIASVTGTAGVKIRLATPPFYFGSVTASAFGAPASRARMTVKY